MSRVSIKGNTLRGQVEIPSSKSMSHRHLLCGALSKGTSTIHKVQTSEDVEATLRVIKVLGAEVLREGTTLHIQGKNFGKGIGPYHFACGESGSTLRFSIPLGMILTGEKSFHGEGGLPKRPLKEYLRNFDNLGIAYEYPNSLPFSTNERLKAGQYRLTGGESSQYLSGLMMALPLLEGDSQIKIEGLMESQDYVTLTQEVLKSHGIVITFTDENTIHIKGGQSYQPRISTVEGDYSQGAFYIVAGLIGEEPLLCTNLKADSQQADRRILEIVSAMGGKLEKLEDGVQVFPSATQGTVIDARQCPDIIPILAVLASLSEGTTEIVNGSRLRIKESDRIKSTVALLQSLGGDVVETAEGMIIQGKKQLLGGFVDSFGDHRIVMAASVAALRCEHPVVIDGAEAVNKSYPKFFEDFASIGGIVHGKL